MKGDELAIALGRFLEITRKETKGLATKIVLWLYGPEHDYAHGLEEGGEELDHGIRRLPKERIDFETYVAFYGAGALQGHITGGAERRAGGGWTGRFEEKRDVQYIHQLLAPNFSSLKVQCGIDYPALNARCQLMNAEPHRSAAILLFQEYLRSVYRSVAGADAETLVKHLEVLPGHRAATELFAQWQEIEQKLKAEKRPALYEVKDGKFFVYEKQGKAKRLINGWLFGLAPDLGSGASDAFELQSDYEKRIAEASFQMRMRLLEAEAGRLLGDAGPDLIGLAADHSSGALGKLLASVDHVVQLAESNAMQDQHRPVAKMLFDRMEKIAAVVGKHPRILAARGIDPDLIREKLVNAQKLKRRM